ncbi:MAG: hypothetical protein AAGJ37_13285, partial [Pseudomonadota bacterium]
MIVELLVIVNFVLLLIIGALVTMVYRSLKSSIHASQDKNILHQSGDAQPPKLQKSAHDVQSRMNKQADDAVKVLSTLQKFV